MVIYFFNFKYSFLVIPVCTLYPFSITSLLVFDNSPTGNITPLTPVCLILGKIRGELRGLSNSLFN